MSRLVAVFRAADVRPGRDPADRSGPDGHR